MKLRGNHFGIQHDVDTVLQQIESVASVVGLQSHIPRIFYVSKPSSINRIALGSPRLATQAVISMLIGNSGRFCRSRCGAERVSVKNNLIAFYPRSSRIVKVFGHLDAFHRHLGGLERFRRSDPKSLSTTEIIAADTDPYPYTVERFIPSPKLKSPITLTSDEIEDLFSFHGHDSDTGELIFSDEDKQLLRAAIGRLELHRRDVEALTQIVELSRHALLVGPTHGDLSIGNMLEYAGQRIIIDWEFYSRGPIGGDLVKLWLQSDTETKHSILRIYNRLSSAAASHTTFDSLSFERQLLLGVFLRLLRLHRKVYDYFLNRDGNEERAQSAFSEHEARLAKCLSSILSLADTVNLAKLS